MFAIRQLWTVLLLFSLVTLITARPQFPDAESHATERKDDVNRVQIKVYRGPTKAEGYAPWGYWVKQPSDDKK